MTRSGQDRDPAATRDRDLAGRPRNTRPRDELGRPLPRTAGADVPRIPDDLTVTGAEAAAMGGELLAKGRPFHAHEVFEAAWKTGPEAERDLWQGLAQVAVGLTHARRGNARGAATLLRRGTQRVRGYAPPAGQPHGIDTAFVIAQAEDLATRIERDGLPAIPAADFLLSLLPEQAR